MIIEISRYWIRDRATGWMVRGSISGRAWGLFSSPPLPDRLWDPQSLLTNG